jgi:mono/diheme cytochrome c family protein
MGGAMGDQRQRSQFGRLVVFKMGGKAQLPALDNGQQRAVPNLSRADTSGDAAVGKTKYEVICSVCHGMGAVSTTAIPDLRYSTAIVDADAFKAIVLEGTLAQKGMVSFASALSPEEVEGVRTWLVQEASQLMQKTQ